MPRLIVDGQIPGTGGGGGATTGPVSWQTPFTLDIVAVTAPTEGAKGTFATLDHPDGSTTGQRFEFAVPADYASGSLVLNAVFAMSTAVASDIRVETEAHIAKLSTGTIDTGSYPAVPATVTPLATTAIDEQVLKTIVAGGFAVGDVVQFFVSRLGADGADTHTGVWQVLAYTVTYTATLGEREITQVATFFQDTDEPAPGPGLKGEFDVLDFSPGTDQEQKFQAYVPLNWDGVNDLTLRLTYAMATAVAANAVISTEAEVGEIVSGSLTALGVVDFTLPGPSTTDITRSTILRSIPAASLSAGDQLSIKVKRKGTDGADTHTGALQLMSAELTTGAISASSSTLTIPVYAQTVDATLAADATGSLQTNRGAGALVTLTLPLGSGVDVGTNVTFRRVASFAFRVDPQAADNFNYSGGSMAVGEYLEMASDGATFRAIWDGTEWLVDLENGTLDEETP
jgi:hypothetical protein